MGIFGGWQSSNETDVGVVKIHICVLLARGLSRTSPCGRGRVHPGSTLLVPCCTLGAMNTSFPSMSCWPPLKVLFAPLLRSYEGIGYRPQTAPFHLVVWGPPSNACGFVARERGDAAFQTQVSALSASLLFAFGPHSGRARCGQVAFRAHSGRIREVAFRPLQGASEAGSVRNERSLFDYAFSNSTRQAQYMPQSCKGKLSTAQQNEPLETLPFSFSVICSVFQPCFPVFLPHLSVRLTGMRVHERCPAGHQACPRTCDAFHKLELGHICVVAADGECPCVPHAPLITQTQLHGSARLQDPNPVTACRTPASFPVVTLHCVQLRWPASSASTACSRCRTASCS